MFICLCIYVHAVSAGVLTDCGEPPDVDAGNQT